MTEQSNKHFFGRNTGDGYIRFHCRRRGLRRLRCRRTAVGRRRHVGGTARCRRCLRQLGGDDTRRAGLDGRGQGQQLGLRDRAAEGLERAHRLPAARQGHSAALPRSMRWSISAAIAPTTTIGLRSAMPAGRIRTCCPISSVRKTMPISMAPHTARAGRCTSTSCAPTIPCSRFFSPPRRKRSFVCARISTPRSRKASASTR